MSQHLNCSKTNIPTPMRFITAFSVAFLLFLYQNTFAQTQTTLDSLVSTLKTLKEDSNKVKQLCDIAALYLKKQDVENCLVYTAQAIELGKKIKTYQGVAAAYNLKGQLYDIFVDNTEMLKNFLMAEEYYAKTQNTRGQSETYMNIAGVYHRIKKDSMAIVYLEKSKKIAEKTKDTLQLAMLMNAEAVIYGEAGNHTKSLESFHAAEKLMLPTNFKYGLAVLYLGMGMVYEQVADYKNAIEYCTRCKELSLENQNKLYEMQGLNCMLKALTALDVKEAKGPVMQLSAMLEEHGDLASKKETAANLKAYYKKIKDFENAYKYAELEQTMSDSLYAMERAKQKDWVAAISRLKEKEKETDELNAKQARKDALIFQQQLTMYVVITALLVIIILLYFQWQSNKQLKKAYELLNHQREEIANKNTALEKVNATKDQLFAIVSHDLMSPVIALNNILEMLRMQAITAEELPEFLDEASVEINNTTAFLRNLLLWAKSQMDGFKIKKEAVNIQEAIQANINLQHIQSQKKNITIIDKSEALSVLADNDLLDTVLRNLISNALKFTANNGRVEISTEKMGNLLKVSVSDNGIGIPKAVQSKILSEGLYSTLGTGNEKGTGIGLTLCKNFVEANGGQLSLQSEEGQGAVFSFTLVLA